jgi:hypothetical protein
MRSRHRVPGFLGLIALLVSALALPVSVTAQATSCADYTSTAAAQFALDINPGLASGLDPDGNGIACDHEGSTSTTAPTSTGLQLPSETPTATGQQPSATVDAVDQQPTNTTTTTTQTTPAAQPGALDGRLGAMRPAFEAVHGTPLEELPSDDNPSIVGRAYTPPAGAVDLFVIYWNDQAAIVFLTAGDPAWTPAEASAAIGNYVPADVTTLPQPELLADGSYLLPVSSPTLAAAVTAEMMAAAGLPGVPGDMYILLVVDSANLVIEVEIGIGNGDNVREDAVGGQTPTPGALGTTPTPGTTTTTPTPTTTTTTTDATAFLQQARAEVTQYQGEIAELRAILNAGTFTDPEIQRLTEIIISWMAVDTTPLNAPPEHAEIANLLQEVHADLSSVGMILFTVVSTGDTTQIQQAADTLTRIETNLTTLDQMLTALGV